MGQIDSCDELIEQIEALGIEATVKAHRKPPLHTRILRDLYELYIDVPNYVEFLAHYPLIPSDLAERIAQEIDPEHIGIAHGLAGNPRSSQQTLNRLTQHENVDVRLELAANPNLTPKEFQSMVEDQSAYVRAAIAKNASLPNSLQFILSEDSDAVVLTALTSRKTLDIDIAIQLSTHSDPLVRAAIINQWSQDPEVLQMWADLDDPLNQQLLLQRSGKLEASAVEALSYAPDSEVRNGALAQVTPSGALMLWLAESDHTDDRVALAERPNLPNSIQRILAQDSSPKVRRRLAANADLAPSLALHIASSTDPQACRALAKNPAIDFECLSQLCLHPDDDIALLVAYRDDLSEQHFDLLINHRLSITVAEHLAYQGFEYTNIQSTPLAALASSDAPSLRQFAARSTHTEDTCFKKLASDPVDSVRLALAQNPHAPEACLRSLMEDSNRDIVFAAEETLNQRNRVTSNQDDFDSDEDFEEDEEEEEEEEEYYERGSTLKRILNFFTE